MHNVLVGVDTSRYAETAVRQGAALARALEARVHLIEAIEPVGPGNIIEIAAGTDPLSILDRTEAITSHADGTPLLDDDGHTAAERLCEEAGAVYTYRSVHGMAVRVLREQCVAMDLLVLGRRGTVGRKLIGGTAASIISRPLIPTLLCRDAVVPWSSILVAYESSTTGGRSLKVAAALASQLNVAMDVVIADPERDRARKAREYVGTVLRAYHIEGEQLVHEGRTSEALQRAALEFQSTVVVVPHGRTCPWPWSRSEAVDSAIHFPNAMALVVP